jgi:hypothetical protein
MCHQNRNENFDRIQNLDFGGKIPLCRGIIIGRRRTIREIAIILEFSLHDFESVIISKDYLLIV